MRNRRSQIGVLCLLVLLSSPSCQNLPNNAAQNEVPQAFLWDVWTETEGVDPSTIIAESTPREVPTPQLVRAIDFERAFSEGNGTSHLPAIDNGGKTDSAEWKYFYPAEYSTNNDEVLQVVFTNTGESTWGNNYHLDYYAGENPSSKDSVLLTAPAAPQNEAIFEIPLKADNPNWTSCWKLMSDRNVQLYEFCYNHGDPNAPKRNTSGPEPSAPKEGTNSEGVFYAFVKTDGSAPEKEGNTGFRSSKVSLEPGNDHTFCAYDHSETLKATFTNTGTEPWTESVTLNFYSGYNWMHTNSYSVNGSVAPGESCTFHMQMEIFEDNDNWNTCWYLAAPDGKTMSEFCFKYHTRGC